MIKLERISGRIANGFFEKSVICDESFCNFWSPEVLNFSCNMCRIDSAR